MNTDNLDEQLRIALEKCNIEETMQAIELGANPNLKAKYTPLGLMCYAKRPIEAKKLIDGGADVHLVVDGYRENYLSLACDSYTAKEEDVLAVVQILLHHGAHPNLAPIGDNSALQYASMYGMTKVVALLLAHGADVHHSGPYGRSALIHAVEGRSCSVELIQTLLKAGADINHTNQEKQNSLSIFIRMGQQQENQAAIAKELITNGIDCQAKAPYDSPYIHEAAFQGKTDIVRVLVESGQIDINLKNDSGKTAIFYALSQPHPNLETIRYLFSAGADVERPKNTGVSVLNFAAKKNDIPFVRALLKKKKDNKHTEGALCTAAENGYLELVQFFLVEAEVDIEDRSMYGVSTPLLYACKEGQYAVVEYLLTKGANIKARTYEEMTPLIIAAYNGHQSIVELLLQHGADVNEYTRHNWTALLHAVSNNQKDTVALLIQRGAAIDIVETEYGLTAVSIAEQKNHASILSLLQDKGAKERPVYLRSLSEGHCTIFDCDICRYIEDTKNLPKTKNMVHLKYLEVLFHEHNGNRYDRSEKRFLRCPNCTTHYYQYYSYYEEDRYICPPSITHKIKRFNYLHGEMFLRSIEKLDDLKKAQENYAPTIERCLFELSLHREIHPYYLRYVLELVEDYFLVREDWAQFEKILLRHTDPRIVEHVIQDWAHMCFSKTYEQIFYDFPEKKVLSKTQQQQFYSFLFTHTPDVDSYRKQLVSKAVHT